MITLEIEQFDLKQIAESGQCFRMNCLSDCLYSVISGEHYLEIRQNENCFEFNCLEEALPFWKHYFDLNTDYAVFLSSIEEGDQYLWNAGKAGSGIRILNQQLWEMIITFIISQQKAIPKIKEAVEALAKRYGEERTILLPNWNNCAILTPRTYCTFPEAVRLGVASLAELKALKLGYRAKYIDEICRQTIEGKLDLQFLAALNYQEAMDYLIAFYGIGIKIANCVCLFGLHHVDAFPVDTWIEKILLSHYYEKRHEILPKTQLCQSIIQEHFASYKGYAGIMQQYIFYYERVILQGK